MTKISQYTAMTTLQSGDLMDISEDLGGSYGSRSITYANLLTNLNSDLAIPAFGAANQMPYMNPGATDFIYSANLTYDGSIMTIVSPLLINTNNELRLGSNTANYNALKSPTGMGSNLTYTLPSAYPTSTGQVLSSTTTGTMSWANNSEPVMKYVSSEAELTTALADFQAAGEAGIAKLNGNITLTGNLTLDFYTGIEIWGGNNQIICGANKIIVQGSRGAFRGVNFAGNVTISGTTTNSQNIIEINSATMSNFRFNECNFNDVVGGSSPASTTDSTYPIVITDTQAYFRFYLDEIGIGTAASGATKPYGPFLIKWNATGKSGAILLFNDWHNRSPEAFSQSTRYQTAKDSMVIKIDNGAASQPSVQRQFIYDESVTLNTSSSMTLDLFPTFFGPTTKIAAVNPTSAATFGNPGDILINGSAIYMKHTGIGSDTNWSQIN